MKGWLGASKFVYFITSILYYITLYGSTVIILYNTIIYYTYELHSNHLKSKLGDNNCAQLSFYKKLNDKQFQDRFI